MKLLSKVLLLFLACTQLVNAKESQEEFDARMQWFDEAKFGLFIHWGSYSALKGVWKGEPIKKYAEWIQANANIPKEEYEPVAKLFQPTNFNADEWIKTAKQAGMKYLVITTKHHEGFCLWDSKYTKYDIKDASGIDRDLLGELSEACKKYGVKFGTYYSIIDWNHPSQVPSKGNWWAKWGNPNWTSPTAKKEYVTYMKAQLKELVDLYDTEVFWFDGDWWKNWTMEDGIDLYNYLREIQPKAIINNRVGKRGKSKIDFGTPENFTPGSKLDYYWEACWTINHSWGYKEHDKNWKTTEELVRKLVDINSKGGNLLLNVGPTAEGEFPEGCLDRLAGMGKWLETHKEAVYKTDFSDVPLQDWGRVLQRGNEYFFHVFDWPTNGQLKVSGLQAEIKSLSLIASSEKLTAKQEGADLVISVPAKGTNPYSSVIKLEAVAGTVKVSNTDTSIEVKEGDLLLGVKKAKISGKGPLKYEATGKNVGYWSSTANVATWKQEIVLPGKYDVILVYASKDGGSSFEITYQGTKEVASLKGKVQKTGAWTKYKTVNAGTLNLPELTNYTFTLKMTEKKGEALFNLKAVILRPKK